jgi:hypothetical protein
MVYWYLTGYNLIVNKKQIFIILGIIAIVVLVLFFWFFSKKSNPVSPIANNGDKTSVLPTTPSLPDVIQTPFFSSSTKNTVTTDTCSGLISIERDDCIIKKAIATKDVKNCSDIQNSANKAYCITTASSKTSLQGNVVLSPYVTIASNSKQATIPQTQISSVIPTFSSEDLEAQVKNFMGNPGSTDTSINDFFDRVSKLKPVLFIVNPVESKSGTIVKATGSGFAKSGNTIFVGGESITNISSADGMTMTFPTPNLSEGRYEVWITNSGGSSRRSDFPIYMTVSNDATPPPTALAISPEVPKLSDTITVSGENLSNVAGVYTSLGTASGLSFKLQDLQFYSLLQKSLSSNPVIKAIPLVIMVMTKSGLSDPLMVNVTTQ